MAKTTIIYANKDTFVSSNSTTLNFGKDFNLLIDGTSKILIYFDLSSIPPNAIITSAKLHLYLYNSYSYDTIINIKKLDSAFDEYRINSDTAPSSSILDSEDVKIKKIAPLHINKFVTFNNLTKTVSSWHGGITANHGFELSSSENFLLSFFSREYSESTLCPNLEVEYNIELQDVPMLETYILPEIVYPTDNTSINTKVYDLSQALSFTYFICNTITDPNLSISSHDILVSIKTCNSFDGTFEDIGNPISIGSNTNKAIEVPMVNKYVRLSINGYENTTVTVDGILKAFCTISPSTVRYCKIVDDTIILTMTKKLTGNITDPAAFSITTPEYFDSSPAVIIVSALVSDLTVTLKCSPNRLFFPNATLTYKAIGHTNLTGANGDVLSFTNYKIDIDLVPVHISETIVPVTKGNSTTIYNASKVESFTYSLNNTTSSNVFLELLQSTTIDGTPIKVGNTILVSPNSSRKTIIKKNYKYVHLSVISSNPDIEQSPVTILVDYMVSPNLLPSTIQNAQIIEYGSKLLLTFTKPLTEIRAKQISNTVFTIDTTFSTLELQVTELSALATTVTLTLKEPIPKDLILSHTSSDYIKITYKATDDTYLSGFNGDVLNFSNYSMNLNLEKATITDTFVASTIPIKTPIFSTIKACYIDYAITNNSLLTPMTVTLLGSNTVNGDFKDIDICSNQSISEDSTFTLPICNSAKYICLSSTRSNNLDPATIKVVNTYLAIADNIPSTVDMIGIFIKFEEDTYIHLKMTKPLFLSPVDPAAFTIYSPEFTTEVLSSKVVARGDGSYIYIYISTNNLTIATTFTITYNSTGTNDINGPNGFVADFLVKYH